MAEKRTVRKSNDLFKKSEVIYSARKSVGLEVTNEGKLIIRAPRNFSVTQLERIVSKKKSWVESAIEKVQHQKTLKSHYFKGNQLSYLGNTYPVSLNFDLEAKVELGKEGFQVNPHHKRRKRNLDSLYINNLLVDWYRRQACEIINSVCEYYTHVLKLEYKEIKITGARTRWGSCSYSNNLNFSWRLLMVPMAMIDYVVLHEILHIKHKDHSPEFWKDVNKMMPDYSYRRDWLRQNRYISSIDFDLKFKLKQQC
jgi:predicted metal-dependent hydrolase